MGTSSPSWVQQHFIPSQPGAAAHARMLHSPNYPPYKGRFFFLSFPFTCLTALKHKFLPRPTCSDQQGPDSKGFKASKPTKAGGAVWLCCSSRLQDVMTWDFKGVLCIRAGVLQPLGKSQCMCLLCLSLIALVNEFLVHWTLRNALLNKMRVINQLSKRARLLIVLTYLSH